MGVSVPSRLRRSSIVETSFRPALRLWAEVLSVQSPELVICGVGLRDVSHDQGLPVLKYATFGEGINVTLGLPIIRTSVDHGTALDLAGTGRADSGSLIAAIDTAVSMARHRRAA